MAKYAPYPDYKESGVEWLGSIPGSWASLKVKHVCSFQKGWGLSKGQIEESGTNSCILYGELYTQYKNDVSITHVKSLTNSSDGLPSQNGQILLPASTTTSGIDLACAKVVRAARVLLGGDIIALSLRDSKNIPEFLAYFLSYVDAVEFARGAKGVTIVHIYPTTIREMPIYLPPADEQLAIVKFLDHETARIDHLIAKQERLIDLLKEKRQAVISHAVTKGLNPDVPMKDSGVEWLGEVPAHWEVTRISRLFRERVEYGKKDLPVLSVSIHYGVTDRELIQEESERKLQRIENREAYKYVERGDLVYNMMRAWQGAFGAAKVGGLVSPAYVVVEPSVRVETDYFEALFRTDVGTEEMRRFSKGITDFRLRLYWDEFRNLRVPLPPIEEQEEIVAKIREVSEKAEVIVAKATRSIALLKEHRAALISAAVTGKIDVRGWNKPEQQQSQRMAKTATG